MEVKRQTSGKNNIQSKTKQEHKPSQNTTVHFTNDFASNLELIKQQIGHNSDVRFRKFNIGRTDIQAGIIFVDGLSDKEIIDKHIMKLLMDDFSDEYKNESSYVEGTVSKEYIKNKVLTISEVAEVHYIKDLIPKVLIGSTALLIDGLADVFILGTTKANKRNMEEPVSEALVRGPRVGFTEVLSDNTSLLRRHCADENLSLVKLPVGERAKKELVVAFIKDLASTELVEEIKTEFRKLT